MIDLDDDDQGQVKEFDPARVEEVSLEWLIR